jgi:predicted metal-dependent phosphoesterase TrpH
MKAELHCHSTHSVGTKVVWEGLNSPAEIMKAAARKGIGAVAITDHNSNGAWKEASAAARREGIVFIPGIEITSTKGHILGLGLNEFIPRGLGVDETVERIHEQGGLAIAAHPYDIKGEGIRDDYRKADAVEIFNALNVDWFANRFTESRLRSVDMPKVVGSDAHNTAMLGHALNIVDAHDMDSVLKAIRLGRVQHEKNYIPVKMISAWAKNRLENSYGYTLDYIAQNYWGPKAWLARRLLDKYVNSHRTVVWNALGVFSISMSRMYGGLKVLSYY